MRASPITNLTLGFIGREFNLDDSFVGSTYNIGDQSVSLGNLGSYRAWTSSTSFSSAGNYNMGRYSQAARLPWVETTAYHLGQYVKTGTTEAPAVGDWVIAAPESWITGDNIYGFNNYGYVAAVGGGYGLVTPQSTTAWGGATLGGNPAFYSVNAGATIALRQILFNARNAEIIVKVGGDTQNVTPPSNCLRIATFVYSNLVSGNRGYYGITSSLGEYTSNFEGYITRTFRGGVADANIISFLSTANYPYRFLLATSDSLN